MRSCIKNAIRKKGNITASAYIAHELENENKGDAKDEEEDN